MLPSTKTKSGKPLFEEPAAPMGFISDEYTVNEIKQLQTLGLQMLAPENVVELVEIDLRAKPPR